MVFMTTKPVAKAILEDQLKKLIALAKSQNIVFTVELKPDQPLAMCNYTMVADVRDSRKHVFISDEVLAQYKNDSEFASTLAGHPYERDVGGGYDRSCKNIWALYKRNKENDVKDERFFLGLMTEEQAKYIFNIN